MDSRTGERITAAHTRNGVFIWEVPNPLFFKILSHENSKYTTNMDILTMRIQFNYNLQRALGVHKCFLTPWVGTTFHPPNGLFLRVFVNQVPEYPNNLGVISINLVMKAVELVLYSVIQQKGYVDQYSDLKVHLY
uniref:Replication enhancer n=1 Tax=Okra enation leaf curl virus TaxID=908125 RepID=A0A0M4AW62_9GEMI|nr:replication enhancer protein [Okra enation leaf curl virus]